MTDLDAGPVVVTSRDDDALARRMANAVRALSMDAIERAGSGHPGLPLGMADVVTALFRDHLSFDPTQPQWPDRDRFVLSAGHGSMLLYAVLHLTGYDVTLDDLRSFRQLGARTAGHPEHGHCPGVETTTGPLGQGLANAVGMAIAERWLNARFGDDLVDHRTYVVAGDGCLMEGISHEAIDLAGHLGLGRLVVLWDDNRISIDGPTGLATGTDQLSRFAAAGWHVTSVDGHDQALVSAAIAAANQDSRPSLVACRTVIGHGSPGKQGTAAAHGSPLGPYEVAATREALGWPYAPFEVPSDVAAAWGSCGTPGSRARAAWQRRLETAPTATRDAWDAYHRPGLADEAARRLESLRVEARADRRSPASRQASQQALAALGDSVPSLLGGSADLTGSNGTQVPGMRDVQAGDFSGRYLRYGVREHAMGAVMNGLSLHGGVRPYGGTFLVFSDYARPALRLAALMQLPVVHVMTHDSIGLGEDGPTHQPVEHLASLRAIPGLHVVRPADAAETADAWQVALQETAAPTVLALSRQSLPALDVSASGNVVSRGGYVVVEPDSARDVTLLATGSEVSLAVAAAEVLATDGVAAAVVSLPCFEVFDAQPREYRSHVLGDVARVGVEAGIRQGWERYLEPQDGFVGMTGFGASAPGPVLYDHFGITVDAVVAAARSVIEQDRPSTGPGSRSTA